MLSALPYPRRLHCDQMGVHTRHHGDRQYLRGSHRHRSALQEWQTPLGGPGNHGLHGAGAALDADLFALFLRSGVPQLYAQSFLPPHQIDGVDVEALLGGS
ncbi:MAG: hypothetical protein ACKO5M_04085 [Vulcanococcus sp.]